jgi:hypothetical protein
LPAVDDVAPPPEPLLVWVELPPDEELPPLPLEAVALVALEDEVSFEDFVLLALFDADDVSVADALLLALSVSVAFFVALRLCEEVWLLVLLSVSVSVLLHVLLAETSRLEELLLLLVTSDELVTFSCEFVPRL